MAFNDDEYDFGTDSLKFKATERYSTGFTSTRGIFGMAITRQDLAKQLEPGLRAAFCGDPAQEQWHPTPSPKELMDKAARESGIRDALAVALAERDGGDPSEYSEEAGALAIYLKTDQKKEGGLTKDVAEYHALLSKLKMQQAAQMQAAQLQAAQMQAMHGMQQQTASNVFNTQIYQGTTTTGGSPQWVGVTATDIAVLGGGGGGGGGGTYIDYDDPRNLPPLKAGTPVAPGVTAPNQSTALLWQKIFKR